MTRKLRRRPNDPIPVPEKRRKPPPAQVNYTLEDKEIESDLKAISRGKMPQNSGSRKPSQCPFLMNLCVLQVSMIVVTPLLILVCIFLQVCFLVCLLPGPYLQFLIVLTRIHELRMGNWSMNADGRSLVLI